MQAFLNKKEIKNDSISKLEKHIFQGDLTKSEYWNGSKGTAVGCTVQSFDCSKYEVELGIPKDVAFLEDAVFNELPLTQGGPFAVNFLESINIGSDLSKLYSQIIIWQFEDVKYGLGSIKEVKRDIELYTYCEEVISLYKKERSGISVSPKEFEALYVKITKAWAISGEKRRVERMEFARKWAYLGARKWAWVSIKSWSGTWAWLMTITRPRSRSQTISIIVNWSKAWKWLRFYRSYAANVKLLSKQILSIIRKTV